jgi:hypothetical protein
VIKPASLRAAIEAILPDVRANPDRLLVFIEDGSLRATAAASLSFEYAYTLNIVITDYAEHADTLIVPVLAWIAANQPELLANADRQPGGMRFEADLLNHSTMDLSLRLTLTERVIVAAQPDGSYTATHIPEPPLDPYDYVETWSLTIRPPDGPSYTP